ncbi:hypothetical protein C453_05189 [Haloferax elongans ATCC BAA-1513]|uniref:NrS-1 polymerase-like HBD domain-containing protein n=1 Tax=Haloferax elongans ATCC BAA-1513 TaxID=1230453 RepID=M0HTB2_HALEO|nr:hypothetical protein [Haloferax elongans]ELZ87721.1 hypothetical protein C453_05189 [Haloferax elongans ATCC BAA-1513]
MTPPLPTRAALPDELLDRPQWVGWRTQTTGGNETKIPLDVSGGYASATDASTWTTFDEALAYATNGEADGVGFVFTDDDPYVGVALDACRERETGATEDWAQVIVDRLDSYTEVDLAGTGYHVIVHGSLPPGGDRTGGLELYERARFLTVTGDRVDETPDSVADRTAELTAIYQAYVESGESPDDPSFVDADSEPPQSTSLASLDAPGNDLSDEAVVERATNTANSLEFRRLWAGDADAYDSREDADSALCSILAFWTGGDPEQMDRLFRESGLYHGKWDEVHFADGETYGEKLIARALEEATEFYDPSGFSSAVRRTASKGEPRASDSSEEAGRDRNRSDGHDYSDGHDHSDGHDGTRDVGTASAADADDTAGAHSDDHSDTHSSDHSGDNSDTHSGDHPADRERRLNELQERVESLVEENDRLRDELAEERRRRRELEATDDEDDEDGGGWSLFGWFK